MFDNNIEKYILLLLALYYKEIRTGFLNLIRDQNTFKGKNNETVFIFVKGHYVIIKIVEIISANTSRFIILNYIYNIYNGLYSYL